MSSIRRQRNRSSHLHSFNDVAMWNCRVICIALGVAISGCAHSRQVTWKLTAPNEMKDVVAKHVPPGTSIVDAQRFMESEGFSCLVERGKGFSERRAWYDAGEKHTNIDFLRCSRSQSDGHILMSRNWSVALVLNGDAVTHVLVGHYIDGP